MTEQNIIELLLGFFIGLSGWLYVSLRYYRKLARLEREAGERWKEWGDECHKDYGNLIKWMKVATKGEEDNADPH